MDQRISIITLGVADLKKSRAFYERLGWKPATEKQSDDIVAFNLQSFVLALYPLEDFAKEIPGKTPVSPDSKTCPTFTLAYNVGAESDVNQIMEEAVKAGATMLKEPQKVFWGGYSGYFSDPDGYLWEVAYNPFSQPAPDGSFEWK